MEKIICPECGIELEPEVKECTNCGYPLDDEYAVFKRKEWKAIKRAKYGIVSSFVVIILFALILHIVGCHNKKERSEKIMNYLTKNEIEFERYDNSDKETFINFDSDGYCYVKVESEEYDDDYEDYKTKTKEGTATTCKVKFSFFGKEYLKIHVVWDDYTESVTWKFPIGIDKKGKVAILGKEGREGVTDPAFYNCDADDEKITYKNSDNIVIFIIIIFLLLVICSVLAWNVHQIREAYKTLVKNKELKEKQDRINKEKEALSVEWDKTMESLGYSSKEYVYLENRNYLWVANEKLYEAENKDSYINRYLGKTDLAHELSYNEIPVSDIQYYSKEGDVQYTTKISGGGGGGSSISGAVVGGLIAGETGAVIGSRQKVQEVTSETVRHDSRRTLIRYYKDNQINVISYIGFEVYDYLLKKIPEKDLLTIQLEKNPVVNEKQSSDSIKDKLETIKQLYENELITKEEYEQKRNEILSKI